ncbi:MAG: response regulator [Tolypothrix sp. T3-bin4]|nr:response regulator [Tolypothrix sp. T3-bin4]
MITADSQIVGMISRTQFFEWLSRPYGLETFLRRPIKSLWRMIADTEEIPDVEQFLEKYLVMSATCPIDKAVELALKRRTSLAYEPIIIEWADGRRRLLDMQVLLLAQSQLFALAKEAADAANRAKSEFLASMSHELRTPLNAILGFTQIMNRDPFLSTEQQQHLGIINRAGEHLLELINDILEMSKIEAGRIALNQTSFDLYRLLDSLREMLQLKASSKGLQLLFDYAPNVPRYVQTDERKLREVLINLLGNAIKFTQQGRVTLRVSMENGEKEELSENPSLSPYSLFFEVQDTGTGIAPEEIEQLFTAFGQTETGRKSGEGTGLGLPISQKFVQLMGGTITVSSNPGQGTRFTFDVRVKLAQAADISKTHQTSRVIGLAPNQPNYRILVVEDRLENRLLLVKLLTSLGFSVREAENGQEALALWSSYSPHLILMDMRMPVMDGYEVTTQIRAHLKGQATVIIALTASAFEEERNIVLSAGCDDFVRKPFREEVLLEKIAKHLGVRYLYEEVKSPDVVSGDGAFEETQGEFMITDQSLPLRLSQMPTEWIEQLHQAANRCLDHVIIQLVKEIPQAHTPLAIALENWANNFLFEQVLDLIQQVQVKEPLFALNN